MTPSNPPPPRCLTLNTSPSHTVCADGRVSANVVQYCDHWPYLILSRLPSAPANVAAHTRPSSTSDPAPHTSKIVRPNCGPRFNHRADTSLLHTSAAKQDDVTPDHQQWVTDVVMDSMLHTLCAEYVVPSSSPQVGHSHVTISSPVWPPSCVHQRVNC
jgi:hypothetical protein